MDQPVSDISRLLFFIDKIVSSNGSFREKRDAILAEASDDEKTSLFEFASWFEE